MIRKPQWRSPSILRRRPNGRGVDGRSYRARRQCPGDDFAAAADFASERRKDIDATVSQMRAEAVDAQDKLQRLAGAGTESWSTLSAALAETRAVFDRANQTAREAFKRATGSTE
jgi:hypothetical protein